LGTQHASYPKIGCTNPSSKTELERRSGHKVRVRFILLKLLSFPISPQAPNLSAAPLRAEAVALDSLQRGEVNLSASVFNYP